MIVNSIVGQTFLNTWKALTFSAFVDTSHICFESEQVEYYNNPCFMNNSYKIMVDVQWA